MAIAVSIWSFLCVLFAILLLWLLIDRLFVHRHNKFISRGINWVLCVIVLFPLLMLLASLISSWRHAGLYDRATVGELWDYSKKPDASTKYGKYEVLYFFGGVFGKEEHAVPAEVRALKDLPQTYCAIELMLAPDGRIVAKTHCGEELHIHTIKGSYKGACLNQLNDSLFTEEKE